MDFNRNNTMSLIKYVLFSSQVDRCTCAPGVSRDGLSFASAMGRARLASLGIRCGASTPVALGGQHVAVAALALRPAG